MWGRPVLTWSWYHLVPGTTLKNVLDCVIKFIHLYFKVTQIVKVRTRRGIWCWTLWRRSRISLEPDEEERSISPYVIYHQHIICVPPPLRSTRFWFWHQIHGFSLDTSRPVEIEDWWCISVWLLWQRSLCTWAAQHCSPVTAASCRPIKFDF